ncbi:MAG: hypothetical protein O7D94_12280, partial [Planctomycetota bacterium]|nr:hypothetical protein [Planctomycetota bacterium]
PQAFGNTACDARRSAQYDLTAKESPVSTPSTPTRPGKKKRFVILRHVLPNDTHFDLMIEAGERLATWRCPNEPETAGGDGMHCEKIGEHRQIYLDYEGPVSGHRGNVYRHDRGSCSIKVQSDVAWELTFHGRRLKGRYALTRLDPDRQSWSLREV